MSDYAKVSITLKAGGNTADPWIVIHADSVSEASGLLHEMVKEGVFTGVKTLSAQFADGPSSTREAVETVRRSFPGAEVVTQDDDPWAGTNVTTQQSRQELPNDQGPPPCPECGSPRQFKSGVGKNSGKEYKGYFCSNRDHKPSFI
jgi:hypothetical protein